MPLKFYKYLFSIALLFTAALPLSPVIAKGDNIDAEDRIISACESKHVTDICIKTCVKYGFKDLFHESDNYSNATNKNCQYALTTLTARKMRSDNTSNIKRLKCVGDLPVCKGSQYQVTFSPQETGHQATIKPPSGKVTKLFQCGTCSDNDWDYESGPLRYALIKGYDGGILLFLDSRR